MLLLVIAGGVVLLTGIPPEEEPAPTVTAPPAPPPAPVITGRKEPAGTTASAPAPVEEPLPRLEESDAVRDAVGDIPLGTAGQRLVPGIIERSGLIYLMAQGDVPYGCYPFTAQGRIPHQRWHPSGYRP